MKLYTYFRSSASYRVRIALNLKGLEAEQLPINLLKGEQTDETYKKINPQTLLPTLITDEGQVLTQSLAIIEYLEEIYPQPPLLPQDALGRARVRALSYSVASDIAPINNLGVLKYLANTLEIPDEEKTRWIRHWIKKGFTSLEVILKETSGAYCYGDTPTLADCCLIPQVFNAKRFECDLAPYPIIMNVYEACDTLPAFKAAHPSQQADAS